MKELIRKNLFFLIPYGVIFLCCIFLLLTFSKSEIHIFINEHYSSFFDVFFKYATYLGDGFFIAMLFIVLLFIRYRYALILGVSAIASSLIFVHPMKRLIFKDVARPSKYFEGIYDLHFVEGVKLHSMHSFPSGHTTAAFALFFSLAVFVENKLLKILFLILACIAGYSRMYLSQHFLIDVTVGSFIGTFTVLITAMIFMKISTPKLDNSILKKA